MGFHRTAGFGVEFDEVVAWVLDDNEATIILEGGALTALATDDEDPSRYAQLKRLIEAFQQSVKHASLDAPPKPAKRAAPAAKASKQPRPAAKPAKPRATR